MTKEILCAEAHHHNFVMTIDTDITFQSLFYQIMGAFVWKYQSECFWTFHGKFIYMKQRSHQLVNP